MSRLAKEASAQEDTHLANQLKLGDEQAFCRLMDKHSGWVYSKTYRTLHNHRDTEEVTMDVFMKVWQKIACGHLKKHIANISQDTASQN